MLGRAFRDDWRRALGTILRPYGEVAERYLALMGALAVLRADRWIGELPVGWLAVFYLLNVLLALGMNVAAGLWLSVVVTLAALALLGFGAQRLALEDVALGAMEGPAAAAPRGRAADPARRRSRRLNRTGARSTRRTTRRRRREWIGESTC